MPSLKLDRKARFAWYSKFIRPWMYGYSYDRVTIPAQYDYVFDTGKWNHENYRQYHLSSKMGYSFNKHIEAGVSFYFRYGSSKTNTFDPNCFSDYKINNLWWKDPIFDITLPKDIKKAALRNRSFVWPEKYRFTVFPYIRIQHKKLSVKVHIFLSNDYNKQEGFASPSHLYVKDNAAVISTSASRYEPYYDYKDYLSYGFNLYPSYKLADWNRLSFALTWHMNVFDAREQAVSPLLSYNIAISGYGTQKYRVEFFKGVNFSAAVEDEIRIKNRVRITAGVSYDAQKLLKYKKRYSDFPEYYGTAYVPRGDASIWGTRDSFNPAVGIVYDPIYDRLRLKAAASIKTRFPLLGEYAKINSVLYDRELKPECSYNGNSGVQLFFLKRSLSAGADYFISCVKNRIQKIAGSDEPPVNIREIVSQGGDFL